jgi:MFS family permease
MATAAHPAGVHQPTTSDIRLVIAASSVGTIFEWYDFFIYGTLAALIGKAFFPAENTTLQLLLVWAGFAVGFGFRPLGAILFGFLGDRMGRKYTFLITVTVMGMATAGVGMVPGSARIGLLAPTIVIALRILQGLALGGEYGGAAIYVSEHAPAGRRGYFSSFIQSSVVGGFVLSVAVVLLSRLSIPPDDFAAWGWRVPFLLSLVLLAVSLWMRLKLSDSPVFQAMKAEGQTSANPFVESFTYPGNKKRIFVVLFGVTAGLTTIWYTAFFSSLSFLKGPMRVDDVVAELVVGGAGLVGMLTYLLFGKLSDRIGRKPPIVWGNLLALVLLFPCFWVMGAAANPELARTAKAAPVVVSGTGCTYDPFADLTGSEQTPCGHVLEKLTALGVPYNVSPGERLQVSVGATAHLVEGAEWSQGASAQETLQQWLSAGGYRFADVRPGFGSLAIIFLALLVLGALSGATYGPVAALLSEMFPPKIRYSSVSIPYHIGAGYLGGFLPLISSYIVARSGNPYSGLWYTWAVVLVALIVSAWGLKGGPPRDFEESE